MQSNGGVARADRAARFPVALAASGPSASVVGAARLAAEVGCTDVLTFDMGGTTTDVALVVGGRPALRPAGAHDGRPLNVPQVDVVSIGAGGGSIARVELGGRLVVGPESAGALPGPAAYGAGGVEATVTDAHVVLGTIRAGAIAGGIVLDAAAARAAIAERVARPLGLAVEEAAESVIRVADANMAGALRLVSVARGRDPRGFALVAAGGAGGLHACGVADLLAIRTVVVPRFPGIAAALGLLLSDERHEARRSLLREVERIDPAELGTVVEELRLDAEELLGSAPGGEVELAADFRYRGQAYNLTVGLGGGDLDDLARAVDAFAAAHEETYGFALPRADVELVTLRARGVRAVRADLPAPPSPPASAPTERSVRLDGVVCAVPVLDRASLAAGSGLHAPAIVEQEDATTVVRTGWSARVGGAGTLVLERR
jgi:N-methylhydantoinase A